MLQELERVTVDVLLKNMRQLRAQVICLPDKLSKNKTEQIREVHSLIQRTIDKFL